MIRQTMLPFKLDFTDELITPNAGLCLYVELFKALKMKKHIHEYFPKPGSAKGYEAHNYVFPILLLFLTGGQYIEDIRKLNNDKALKKVCCLDVIPSPDAAGDWMRANSDFKICGSEKLHNNLSAQFLKYQKRFSHTLDIDAFNIFANKSSAEMTYKGEKGYMPIVGHLSELDWCIGYEFREGNIAPADRNYEFILQCIRNLPKGHKIARLRADGAGYQAKIFNYLDQNGIKFAISGCKNNPMKNEIAAIPKDAWKKLKNRDGYYMGRDVAESYAKMENTEYFRIVVQRWLNPNMDLDGKEPEYCYHVICTNYSQEEKTSKEIIEWHNGRGNSENYHKEIKSGFNLKYVPCDNFKANAIWFALCFLAYNLHIFAKVHLLPEGWRKKTITSIRWQLINIAGKVVSHEKKIWLKLAGITQDLYEIFEKARYRCWQLSIAG